LKYDFTWKGFYIAAKRVQSGSVIAGNSLVGELGSEGSGWRNSKKVMVDPVG